MKAAAGRYVGQRVQRREDARLVTGHGRYVDDIVVPGALHAAFVRSDLAHGRIDSVDVTEALALPGVHAVLLGEDLNPGMHEVWFTMVGREAGGPPMKALASGDVRFVGDPVALVLADSRYIAEDACDLIWAEIDPLPPVLGVEKALEDSENRVHPEYPSNLAQEIPSIPNPQVDEAFADAPHAFTETFHQHRHMNVPMETRGIIAHWEPQTGEFVMWAATQSAHELRLFTSRMLDLSENRIRVIARDVGGGFGQKMFPMREEMAIILASHKIGKPIRWIEDRRENLMASNHAREETLSVSFALDDDGRLLGARTDHIEDVGAYPFPGTGAMSPMSALVFPGPYRLPCYAMTARAAYTNTCGKAAYRGPWMMETVAREQMMDHIARKLAIDPLELRRRNVIQQAELPFTSASQAVYERISPAETLEQAAEIVDYNGFREEQAAARLEGRYLGLGISLYVEPTQSGIGSLGTEAATVQVEPSGKVTVLMGSTSHGHSLETTMIQVVAEELGCDLEDVTLIQGDTAGTPYGAGTGGSRSAVLGGGAAGLASQNVRETAIEIAAHVLGASPEDLDIEDGRVFVVGQPHRGLTLGEIAETSYVGHEQLPPHIKPGLQASVRYKAPGFVWANCCQICTVEVDTRTGFVKILRWIVSEDCGNMINPMVVEGQIAGGAAQGIGGVMYEHMIYDEDGNPLTTSFMDYLLPTAAEIPDFEYGHVTTPSLTPGGYKGMGEGGAIGSPSALMNAISDALSPFGVELTRQPATPPTIIAALDGRIRHDAPDA
jgi:aerobic carbon-monoxide dehydrogenase large subunit